MSSAAKAALARLTTQQSSPDAAQAWGSDEAARTDVRRAAQALLDYQHYALAGMLESMRLLHQICARATDPEKRRVDSAKLYKKLGANISFELAEQLLYQAGWRRQTMSFEKKWVWAPEHAADAPDRLKLACELLGAQSRELEARIERGSHSSRTQRQQQESARVAVEANILDDKRKRRLQQAAADARLARLRKETEIKDREATTEHDNEVPNSPC